MRQIVSTNQAVELAISKENGQIASSGSDAGENTSPKTDVGVKQIMARSARTAS